MLKLINYYLLIISLSICAIHCIQEVNNSGENEVPDNFVDKSDRNNSDMNQTQEEVEDILNTSPVINTTMVSVLGNESMAQIYKQLLIEHEGNDSIVSSTEYSNTTTIISDQTESEENTTSIGNELNITLASNPSSIVGMDETSEQSIMNVTDEKSGETESNTSTITTIVTTHKTTTTVNPKYQKLIDDSSDDITLPPGFENGFFTVKPVEVSTKVPKIISRYNEAPPLPMYPIMPPNLPEDPGYQTIWIPIQVPRDPYSLDQMWKKSKTPTFIERGRLRNRPSALEGTQKSWWRRTQPRFCLDPIYVNELCMDRRSVKRWSYNQADERCYRYIDYCFADKLNSFDTLQQCLTACWRA